MAPILEADPQQFIIYYQERAVTYGERGEIIPRKSRVKILETPMNFRKMNFSDQPYASILPIAGSDFVSGKLESPAGFECVSASPSIYSKGSELFFNFADSATLAGVRIVKKKDDSSLSRLEENIGLLENEILTLESQLPGNVKRRLFSCLSSLSTRRQALVENLSVETEPVARLTLQEEIQMIHKEELQIRLQISSLDMTDPTVPLKIQRANLKLNRMKLDYESALDDEVLFTGELGFRKLK